MESPLGWIAVILLVLLTGGGLLVGCPQYNVYSSRLSGEAEQAKAVGARQALVSQAQAEKDAAKLRADAAKTRVDGWVDAAIDGCKRLGRENDQTCVRDLIHASLVFATAHEGHPGVNIIIGTNGGPSVAIPTK